MGNALIKLLQEARKYYQNKPSKYNLTPEQLKQLNEQLTGKPSVDDEQENREE
jgi:exopolyphosphatase/pppGpp-phosphohydrolase